MIILAKYVRSSRIRKQNVKTYRTSRLFEPVIWIGRDHCWIPSPSKDGYVPWQWYIIVWKIERYIDARGYEKSSILPKYKFGLTSKRWHIIYFGKNKHQWYDIWRGYIYNPIKRLCNIHIKNPVYRYFIKR